ncbi:phage tail protein [uncultured Methylobacterium sp.]|mgnify:CR=1 FL=1|uniref:phage tail-collar fiber domain-containing protein n=1 Tax=uncultured Methylobacterium sp. TaxID=157278 RepID=UPI002625B5C2|nr:phage tail protein [uncultured Methylobacterium sp.]
MSDVEPIKPTITAAGIAKARAATEGGFKISITHVGLGDGAGAGYTVTRNQTKLVRERLKVPIGGGEVIGEDSVALNTIVPPGETFPIRELGFYSDDVLFAVWSEPVELAARPTRASLILQFTLRLLGIPADVVTVSTSGMSLNISIAPAMSDLSLAIVQLQERSLSQDVARFSDVIRSTLR